MPNLSPRTPCVLIALLFCHLAWADSKEETKELPWDAIHGKSYHAATAAALQLALGDDDEAKTAEYKRRCEEKLGAVPDLEKDKIKEIRLFVSLKGKKVVPHPDPDGPPHYVEKTDGNRVKHTPVEKEYVSDAKGALKICDNPRLAAGDEPCDYTGSNSLISLKAAKGTKDIYWVAIRRKDEDPTGIIGWDSVKGTSCFFSYREKKDEKEGEKGDEKDDKKEKAEKKKPKEWVLSRPGDDNCMGCHTQSDPFTVTPHLRSAWNELGIPRKMDAFVDGDYRYHVPGVELSGLEPHSVVLEVSKKGGEPNTTCTRCHQVTGYGRNDVGGNYILADAVGHSPPNPKADGLRRRLGQPALHWMPRTAKQTADIDDAIKAVTDFTQSKANTQVKAKAVQNCDRLKEALGKVSAIKGDGKDGSRSLRWRFDDFREPLKAEDIRFEIYARAKTESGRLLGVKHYASAGEASDSGKRWEFKHRLPATRDLAIIEYTITPVVYRPRDLDCPLVVGEPTFAEFDPKADGDTPTREWRTRRH